MPAGLHSNRGAVTVNRSAKDQFGFQHLAVGVDADPLDTGHARKKEAETRLLTAALPEGDAQSVIEMLSASTPAVLGWPV